MIKKLIYLVLVMIICTSCKENYDCPCIVTSVNLTYEVGLYKVEALEAADCCETIITYTKHKYELGDTLIQ